MNTDSNTLAIRLKRLTLDKKRQNELVEGIKDLDDAQLKQMQMLLDEHDAECLKLLNEKLQKRTASFQKLAQEMQGKEPSTDLGEFQKLLTDVMQTPESFALFLSLADDQVISALEDTILAAAPEQQKNELKEFFNQVRVHKSTVIQREEKAVKDKLVEQVKSREKQVEELKKVLEQVEQETKPRKR